MTIVHRIYVCHKDIIIIQMFDLLKSSVDRMLTNLGGFEYRGEEFTIRRHEFAPVTLRVRGADRSCEVDLVPSFQYDFRYNLFYNGFLGLIYVF